MSEPVDFSIGKTAEKLLLRDSTNLQPCLFNFFYFLFKPPFYFFGV